LKRNPTIWRKKRGGKFYGAWYVTVEGEDVCLGTKDANLASDLVPAAQAGRRNFQTDAQAVAEQLDAGGAGGGAGELAGAVGPPAASPPPAPSPAPPAAPPAPPAPPTAPAPSSDEAARLEAEATNAAAAATAPAAAAAANDNAAPMPCESNVRKCAGWR